MIDNCSKNGVNGENDFVRLAYPEPDMVPYPSPAPAFIIVGGSTLSRGLTIEGLVSTFFLRASCQADTLMQMGRWFGYRRNYELLPRIWMTADTMEKFRFLSELEVDLREDLRKYMQSGVTPIEYGPRILCSPKVSWLRLTSKNHSKNAKAAEMDFSGARPQTVVFDKNAEIQQRNIDITEAFIEKLGMPSLSADNVSLYWKNVSLDIIMRELLIDKFSFCNRSRVFNEIDTFCDWIKQLSHEQELNNWSVIVGGNGKLKVNCQVADDEKYWIVGDYQIGKVERSRRKPLGDVDTAIDIGVLRSIKDQLADIDKQYIKDYEPITMQSQVDEIRKAAGADRTPLLIIYRIDKNSRKRKNSDNRMDLNFECDIIGIQICIPGEQVNRNFCKKLTIQLPEKDKEDEVEEIA